MGKGQRITVDAAVGGVRPRDTLVGGVGAGQPAGFIGALGARRDLTDVTLYTGLLVQPYTLLQSPGVRIISGFFGPIERMARAMRNAVEAGRDAYLAGRIPRKLYASASSPIEGMPGGVRRPS